MVATSTKTAQERQLKDSAGHVSFELGCRDELAILVSLLKQLREILSFAYNLNKATCSFSFL